MIIRSSLACETCGAPHVVRIGMGQEERQSHRFACRGCGEDIVVVLEVDYARLGWRTILEENAAPCEELEGSHIVNVDANFPIPEDQQGVDLAFPRLGQMHKMAKAAPGGLVDLKDLSPEQLAARPFRRPDYAGEWKRLKKAWSLHRNGRDKLSRRQIDAASQDLYSEDPLSDLPDWIWRLTMGLCQPAYESHLLDVMEAIRPVFPSERMALLARHYDENMATARGGQYFELMKAYFASYSEFAQVQFLIARGLAIPDDHKASSADFDSVRMFYGNAFEAFADLVDILAFLNNLLAGRGFDTFEALTLKKYYGLDKSSRFNPFALNPAFFRLCEEADNQLRNASHHGRLAFESAAQLVRYRVGKGRTGPEQTLSYTEYLQRCVRIFLQAMTLLRAELIICNQFGIRHPV